MFLKKYSSDYLLTEDLNSRGHMKISAVYTGGAYVPEQIEASAAAVRKCFVCAVVSTAAFVAALLPELQAARQIYVLLPFEFLAVVLFLQLRADLPFLKGKGPWKHEQADRLNALPGHITGQIVLSLISEAGVLIGTATGSRVCAGDLCFVLCAALIAGCGIYTVRLRRFLRCEKQ